MNIIDIAFASLGFIWAIFLGLVAIGKIDIASHPMVYDETSKKTMKSYAAVLSLIALSTFIENLYEIIYV